MNAFITLETIIFLYIAYLAGSAVLSALRIHFSHKTLKRAYAIICGLGLIGLAGFTLAVVGQFSAATLWALVLVLAVLTRKNILSHIGKLLVLTEPRILIAKLRKVFSGNTILKIIVALWLTVNFIIAFVPITGHDTLDYHLPIINDIVADGSLSYGLDLTSIPFFGEIIYAVPTAMFADHSAPHVFQLIQWSTMPLLLILIYGTFSTRIHNKFLRLILILFVLSMMDLWREVMHGGYVDLLAYIFGFGGLFLIFTEVMRGAIARNMSILSGILIGLSLSVKYTGLFFLAAIVLLLIIYLLNQAHAKKTLVKPALLFIVAVVSISSFWYLKNIAEHQNPVYPMFSNTQATNHINFFIVERDLSGYLSFPYWRFGGWFYQTNETSSRLIILAYFIIFALLTIISALVRARWRKETWLTTAVFLFLYSLLFLASHQIRFFLPVLIALCIAITFQFDTLYEWLKIKKPRLHLLILRASKFGLPILFFAVFLGNLHYFYVRWYYKLGIYDEPTYIEEIGGQ